MFAYSVSKVQRLVTWTLIRCFSWFIRFSNCWESGIRAGPRKHNCRPFCRREKLFDFSESVFSFRPTQHCCICVREAIVAAKKDTLSREMLQIKVAPVRYNFNHPLEATTILRRADDHTTVQVQMILSGLGVSGRIRWSAFLIRVFLYKEDCIDLPRLQNT